MNRLLRRNFVRLAKLSVLAIAAPCLVVMFGADRAHATGTTRTCAQLDTTQGGAPINAAGFTLLLTVVANDRINVTNAPATVTFTPPGGALGTTASPAVFNVGAGQAGQWQIEGVGSTSTVVSCTVGGALAQNGTTGTGPTADDKSDITGHLASTFNQLGGAIFDPEGVPGTITNGGSANGTGFSFAPNASAFGTAIDTTNPMDRLYGFANEPRGIAALTDRNAGNGFSFNIDMRSLIANAHKRDALGAGSVKDDGSAPHSPWNSWVSGRYVDFDDDQVNADRDGHLWWVTSGLSFQMSEHTTLGAFSRVRQGEVDSSAFNAELDSDFFGGGVFLVTQAPGGIRVLAGVLYEGGDNDIRIATATGSYDSDQWTVEARVDKRITNGRHWIEPAVKVLYTDLGNDSYTDSLGVVVSGSDLTLGRLTFGPTIGTTIERGDAAIKPFARINGVWDFVNEDQFTLSNGVIVSSADTAINLGGGVEVAYANGIVLMAAGDWFNFDTELKGWSVTGAFGAPLAVFGLGAIAPTGFVSLGFTGNDQTASTNASLKIPLN